MCRECKVRLREVGRVSSSNHKARSDIAENFHQKLSHFYTKTSKYVTLCGLNFNLKIKKKSYLAENPKCLSMFHVTTALLTNIRVVYYSGTCCIADWYIGTQLRNLYYVILWRIEIFTPGLSYVYELVFVNAAYHCS
jgi:hypothetical protein